MKGHQLLALCAVFSFVPAVPLAAQQLALPRGGQPEPQAQDGGQSVTVIGERPDDEAERRREASRYFESHAVRTRIGELARWHDPICVRTWGLAPEMNARIATRIMDIADGLGIRTNRAALCRPNVRIGFTSEPQASVERAARRNRLVIGFHYAARRDEVMRVRQPVQAWYLTTTRPGPNGGGIEQGAHRGETIDEAGVRAPGGAAGSRLSNGISSGLAHVLIFADIRHVEGRNVDSIAELLAFLALAQTPVAERCDESETILNLMNAACPPERRPMALTRQDVAYLRALYSVDSEWGPQLQRGTIVLHMTDALGGNR